MRILIVEDEKKAAGFLRKGLTDSGFVADVATNGEDGLFKALSFDYDLIILDAMLPRQDGWWSWRAREWRHSCRSGSFRGRRAKSRAPTLGVLPAS